MLGSVPASQRTAALQAAQRHAATQQQLVVQPQLLAASQGADADATAGQRAGQGACCGDAARLGCCIHRTEQGRVQPLVVSTLPIGKNQGTGTAGKSLLHHHT